MASGRGIWNLVQWKLVFHPKLGRNWKSLKCLFPRYHLSASCSGVSSSRSLKWSTRAYHTHGRDSVSGRRFDITLLSGDSEASLLFLAFCLSSQKRKGRPFRKPEDFGHFLQAMYGGSHPSACCDWEKCWRAWIILLSGWSAWTLAGEFSFVWT